MRAQKFAPLQAAPIRQVTPYSLLFTSIEVLPSGCGRKSLRPYRLRPSVRLLFYFLLFTLYLARSAFTLYLRALLANIHVVRQNGAVSVARP
jgi:hypothetical protein